MTVYPSSKGCASLLAQGARVNAPRGRWPLEPLRRDHIMGEGEEEPQLAPTDEGKEALDVIVWAASHLDVPIRLVGPRRQVERAQQLLSDRGDEVETRPGGGDVRAQWGS